MKKVTAGYVAAAVYILFPILAGMFGHGHRSNFSVGDKLMNGFAAFGYGVVGVGLWWYFADSVKDKSDGAIIGLATCVMFAFMVAL